MHAPIVVLKLREEQILEAASLGYSDVVQMSKELSPQRVRMHLAQARWEAQRARLEVEHYDFPMRFDPTSLN